MKRLLISTVLCSSFIYGDAVTSWRNFVENDSNKIEKKQLLKTSQTFYEYLNSLRTATGMNALTYNSYLEQSSQNHANYVVTNSFVSHNESSSYPDFTGVTPSDRAFHVGFNSSISENLSVGQSDYKESIDDLFGAIYHRFGFLDFGIDLVGIANSGSGNLNTFVYNMGNAQIESLCQGESYNGYEQYYFKVCKDENKNIVSSAWDSAKNITNPDYVIWPYKNYNDVPPAFFEESPDPLPNQSVSGYPASIQFNKASYPSGVNLESFELFDKNMQKINDVQLLDKNSDPNGKFSEYEFALFPTYRLDWGKVYNAKVVYENKATNALKTISWQFRTRALEYDYFILENTSENINLVPNKSYVLYIKPQGVNEVLNSYNITYDYGVSNTIEYLDQNTFLVNFGGDLGKNASIKFANGRSVNITLASSDTAISKTVQDSELVDNYKFQTLSSGWHLLGAVETINDMSLFDNVSVVWTYKNGDWYVYSNDTTTNETIQNSSFKDFVIDSIEQGNGFWILKK